MISYLFFKLDHFVKLKQKMQTLLIQFLKSTFLFKYCIILSHALPVVIKLNIVFFSLFIWGTISYFIKSNDSMSLHNMNAPGVTLSK